MIRETDNRMEWLNKKIDRFSVIESNARYAEYNMEPFCPKCGCLEHEGTGNMVSCPEHYEKFYCKNCEFKVGIIDNSRFVHCLEFEDLDATI